MSAKSSQVVCTGDAWRGRAHQRFLVLYQQRGHLLPGSLTLGLLLAGLMSGLLALAGAALMETKPASGEKPALGENPPLSCTAFQIGSPHAANTRIHLENAGPESSSVRFDFVDDQGLNPWASSYSHSLEGWASNDVVFRTPALGAAITLTSAGRNLHASAEILRHDGAPPELRPSIQCLPRQTPTMPPTSVGGR